MKPLCFCMLVLDFSRHNVKQATPVFTSCSASVRPDKALPYLAKLQFCPGIGKVTPSHAMEGGDNRCQCYGLGWSVQHPDCPGDMVPTGVKASHQHSWTESHQIIATILDLHSARSSSQGAVDKSSDLHKPSGRDTRSQTALKETSLKFTFQLSQQSTFLVRQLELWKTRPEGMVFAPRDLSKPLSKEG